MIRKLLTYTLVLLSFSLRAQHVHDHPNGGHGSDDVHATPADQTKTSDRTAFWIKYQENRGQWRDDLLFLGKTSSMDIFIGEGKFMLQVKNRDDFDLLHAAHHGEITLPDDFGIRMHNIEFSLLSPQKSAVVGRGKLEEYVNYFLGSDSSRWAGGVPQFDEVVMQEVYAGIDLVLSSSGDHAKYEFEVAAGANPSQIAFRIAGADALYLRGDQLVLENSCDELVDGKPVAWQWINGKQVFVDCAYDLRHDTLGFRMGTYDNQHALILDPTLIFSTFTGSSPTDNWGSTATYDSLGNLYAGGIVVSSLGGSMNGYPTTTGAFQLSYQGGSAGGLGSDIVITKFNATGTSLIFSTYLGGDHNEIPHSLVVNSNNQLYVLGTTSSSDFPTTSGCYDNSFAGGPFIGTGATGNNNSSGVPYVNGSDIIITKFNASGTALLGSTFIGGTGNDGINMSDTLQRAYSDEFRGEIIVDNSDNCYVATSTNSSDFPTVNGFQNAFGGGITDGVVFKFNSGLSSLLWSTYIGGSNADGAYSLQFDQSLNVFVTGGTKSTNFPTTSGVINATYQGGTCDGWVAKISNNGQNLLASTYLGTNNYDQSFFVQLDLQGNVYCVGQSLGSYPIGPSWVYSVANSGQFLHKLTNNLQTTVFSTRWGSGNNNINLSLSAFLVNQCNHIFVAGWGGNLFSSGSATSNATTTNGLPVTANAAQTTTDGNDMYFIVFEDSAKNVLFASYFGGTGTSGREHVDGGTSRFDKKGIIYQAVCAGCGGGSTFPTTSGAYATQNGSNNCNLAAIKYDLVTLIAEADVDGPTNVCVNDSVHFANESYGGSLYAWDFGDGTTSQLFEPSHAYSQSGDYTVTLIIYDSVSCISADTDYIEIHVTGGPSASVINLPTVCPNTPVQLQASGGLSYHWSNASYLNNPNISNPVANVPNSTTFIVSVTDSCGTDTAHLRVRVHKDLTDAIPDTTVCKGLGAQLWATGGTSYLWSPPTYLSANNIANPYCQPDTVIHYNVVITDSFNCKRSHPVSVFTEGFVPKVNAWGDTSVCRGDRVLLSATGTNNYQWIPETWVLDPLLPMTPAYPEATISYVVRTFNSCGAATDTVHIEVSPVDVVADEDTAVCFGDSVHLRAKGALVYRWSGPAFDQPTFNPYPSILPDSSAWYVVRGSNLIGCHWYDSTYVTVHPNPTLTLATRPDTISGLENMRLVAHGSSPHRWYSSGYVPCSDCDTIVVYPRYKTTYYIEVVDSNQCRISDSIEVQAISKIYVPNSFTPDGDGLNDLFLVHGHNIMDFQIVVRDRWGAVMYQSQDMLEGWNGRTHNTGKEASIGVYFYEVRYTFLPYEDLLQSGTVTLIR